VALSVDIKKNLGDFDLNIKFRADQEVLALLGASGCGKSMTLKCIAGIETPDCGVIKLDDHVLFDSERKINLPPQKRKVGYLFQNYALFPNMTVVENIAFVVQGTKQEKRKVVTEKVKMFCLEGLEHLYPLQLSGGQQQRVAFARILASETKLLMLDEPFSALDSYLKWQVEQELTSLLENYNRATLFVSHNRDEVYRICDRIAVMSNGNIDTIRTKHDLFESPETLAGTILTGCKNISTAKKINDHIVFAEEWGLQLQVDRPVPDNVQYVGFRAHFFSFTKHQKNAFEAEIVKVVEDTFSFIVMIRPKGLDVTPLRWELEKAQWQSLDKTKLFLSIPEDKIILMKK
jgi:molybdate transport system ATP-binding protein